MKQGKYPHREIERKWQRYWLENKTFRSEVDYSKKKYYILDMFPYPSGTGLHVGHVTGYTATDVVARYKRQKGFNVLHPMGWDSFGLQAEQYAIRTGTHPKESTATNINTYRRQLQSLGFSYDWDREITTSDPSYYKWTQWIFTKLYEKGLAYEADVLVNYCPQLGTVLANEEVEEGKSVEGGYPVIRAPLKQWVLKITSYAERLLEGLEHLHWPEHLKTLQRNWIGKKSGAKVIFKTEEKEMAISTFTTRPDTIFGVTFLVLSPEHPLIEQIVLPQYRETIDRFKEEVARKSDFERTEGNREKRGVWSGAYVRHPLETRRIPIWIGDYVLMGYGTGAVMGVPGGDARDFDFAKRYHLPIIPICDPLFSGAQCKERGEREKIRSEVLRGEKCWEGEGRAWHRKGLPLDINGLEIEQAKEKVIGWLEEHQCGGRFTTYKLRDWIFSRQRYWGEPFPIIHFEDGSQRLLDLDELPLSLPDLSSYHPQQGLGRTPLHSAEEWVNLYDVKRGKRGKRETNTMPQWAGSCWYYLRFCDPHNKEEGWSCSAERYWMPVDLYVGGVEHAVLHLLYARFWHKVLYDCGHVSTEEPFHTLRNQGLILAQAYRLSSGGYVPLDQLSKQGKVWTYQGEEVVPSLEKMSKSKWNGVTPDEIVEQYGADTLRIYELFMGPFDKEKVWDSQSIHGCRRFLDRFYGLVYSNRVVDQPHLEGMKLAHHLINGVERDIEGMLLNTAIAKMMEFVNAFSRLECYPKEGLKMAVQVLSPFAPHLAEECWQFLTGGTTSLTYEPYPVADRDLLIEEKVTYIIQVDGRCRGKWESSKGRSQEEVWEFVQSSPLYARHLEGKQIKRCIFVPNKLMNIVTSS